MTFVVKPSSSGNRPATGDHEKNVVKRIYIPLIEGESVILPKRCDSLLSIKMHGVRANFLTRSMKGKGKKSAEHMPANMRARLNLILMSNLGIGRKSAEVITSRKITTIARIEEEIRSIVDCFLLGFPELFARSRRDIFTHLIRVCFNVGCSSDIDDVSKAWKEFTNYLWMSISRSTSLEPVEIKGSNPFKRYLDIPEIKEMFETIPTKRQVEKLIHLISTRGLVPGGKRTIRKSLEEFREVTETAFTISELELSRVSTASYQLGRKVLHFLKEKDGIPQSAAHLSLSGAGDFDRTIQDGGRCSSILEAITEPLTRVASTTRTFFNEYGEELFEEEGIQVWRTWYRPKRLDRPHDFGEEMIGLPDYWNDDRRAGFDDALGHQIFYLALLESRKWGFNGETDYQHIKPIPTRVDCVPENGCKARCVTMTLWWVVVLQQPAGHFLKTCLGAHPSASAGLTRADQAWLWLETLSLADLSCLDEDDTYYLSSDLKCATDSLDPVTVYTELIAFLSGLGVATNVLNLAIQIFCSRREVYLPSGEKYIKLRGVLMGEPLCKSALTIHNLITEEAAIRSYLGTPEGPVQVPWRCFAVGGDDHVAAGPTKYLDEITANHIKWSSQISRQKHGKSRYMIKYCEKALYFPGCEPKMKSFLINKSTENYNRSVFVDSVKVRLLSPMGKSIDVQNDRNIAIGKAKSFGRTLRWLNNDIFPLWWRKMVRDRFFERMRSYLPKVGKGVYYHLLLPEEFGGLDLYFPDELQTIWDCIPLPSRQYIYKLINGLADTKLVNRFKRFTSNDTMRGVNFEDLFKVAVDIYDFDELGYYVNLPVLDGFTIFEARDKCKIPTSLPMGKVVGILNSKGYYYSKQICDMALRPTLFNKMLAKKTTNVMYNTTPWSVRYAELWDETIDSSPEFLGKELVLEDLNLITKPGNFLPLKFFNVDTEDYPGGPTFRELIEAGLPNLRLPYYLDGFKHEAPKEYADPGDVHRYFNIYFNTFYESSDED